MLLSPNLFTAVTGPKHFQGQSFIIVGKYFGLAAAPELHYARAFYRVFGCEYVFSIVTFR